MALLSKGQPPRRSDLSAPKESHTCLFRHTEIHTTDRLIVERNPESRCIRIQNPVFVCNRKYSLKIVGKRCYRFLFCSRMTTTDPCLITDNDQCFILICNTAPRIIFQKSPINIDVSCFIPPRGEYQRNCTRNSYRLHNRHVRCCFYTKNGLSTL
jgi:hypothetical protein